MSWFMRRLGIRPPTPPTRLARIDDKGVGVHYAVAGINGRTWVTDSRGRTVDAMRRRVNITSGMIKDTRGVVGECPGWVG